MLGSVNDILSVSMVKYKDGHSLVRRTTKCLCILKDKHAYTLCLKFSHLFCFIQAQGGTVAAHKNVLAASSEYFNAMFSHQMAESSASEVTLEGVDVSMLQHLITFMYTGVLQGMTIRYSLSH